MANREELVQLYKEARAEGRDDIASKALDAIEALDTDISTGESLLAGTAKGASANFADEIGGFASAAIQKAMGLDETMALGEEDKSFGDMYTQERDFFREDMAKAQEANPAAFATGQFGGGLLTAAATPSSLVGATGYGAAMGAGDAAEMEDVPLEALKSGAVGLTGYGLTKGIGKGLEATKAPLLKRAEDVRKATGPEGLTLGDALTTAPALLTGGMDAGIGAYLGKKFVADPLLKASTSKIGRENVADVIANNANRFAKWGDTLQNAFASGSSKTITAAHETLLASDPEYAAVYSEILAKESLKENPKKLTGLLQERADNARRRGHGARSSGLL